MDSLNGPNTVKGTVTEIKERCRQRNCKRKEDRTVRVNDQVNDRRMFALEKRKSSFYGCG